MLNGAVAVALLFGVAIAKSGVLSKWVGVDKKMLDHFNIVISSDNNNVTPNVGVDYEPTRRLGADTINEIRVYAMDMQICNNSLYKSYYPFLGKRH